MTLPPHRETIRRSWERCARHGLATEAGISPGLGRDALHQCLGENGRLVSYAQPLIEHLHQSLARTPSLIVLADAQGTILRISGDPGTTSRAETLGLVSGQRWNEEAKGTNAIGLALVEGSAVAVMGDEHYLAMLRILRGIACPVPHPETGDAIIGVLAILSDGDISIPHARALMQNAADLIETRLVETHSGARCQVRIAPSQEALSTPLEGILALNGEGRVVALNRRAREFTGNSQGQTVETALRLSPQEKQRLLRSDALRPLCLMDRERQTFWARTLHPDGPLPTVPTTAWTQTEIGVPDSAPLQALDTGDPRMRSAIQRALRVVDRNIPLMIQGETGCGKEVFAQACHRSSRRANGPFIAINCAAIPANLIEAELFGYSEGAFTGARAQGAAGKLREANGGTLFLDEIGDMPLALQSVLLRVLETRSVTPLGGGEEIALDIAIVCASHQPLQEKVTAGTFRSDLYFRLNGMALVLPPLRERTDLAALARCLLEEELGTDAPAISPEALALLQRNPWPGNIRQLRNVLRLAAALLETDESILEPRHLPAELAETQDEQITCTDNSLRACEVRLIKEAVARYGGNISAAARELGITRTTLYRKLQQEQ